MSDPGRLQRLFHEACDLTPDEQARFVARECADDLDLHRELEELLAEDRDGHLELERPAAAHLRGDAGPPERIGAYRVLGVLGAGGMGVVYEAEQDRPRRRVALKVVRPGLTTPALLARFEHEAEVLGWLDHPGIARIFEAGTADTGQGPQPFFAMELVAGVPLGEFTERGGLDLAGRLELIAKVCDAVHHAHQKGVVHRDLKPANVLVTAEGQPKILDFGVARITGADIEATTRHTAAGEILGTLPYMSPEQLQADRARVDSRADVYALGVLAYELLSRRRPHDVGSTPLPEAIRAILQDEPTALGSIDRTLAGDVATIVDKAMAKERERRYGSAAELAADLRRFLADEPIVARPASRAYQLRKFARRNQALVVGVAAVFVVLLAGAITSTLLYFEKEAQRAEAEQRGVDLNLALGEATTNLERALDAEARAVYEADSAQAVTDFLMALFGGARLEGGKLSALDLVDEGVERVRGEFEDRPEIRLRLLNLFGQIYNYTFLYERSRPLLEEALAVTAELHGEDSAEYAEPLERLAHIYLENEDLDTAERLQRRVLDLRARHLGEDDPLYTDALNNLGNTLMSQAAYDEAESLLALARDLRAARLGPDHPRVGACEHNLGLLEAYRGNYEAAVAYLEGALPKLETQTGPDSWRAVSTQVALADTLRLLGRHERALEHGRAGYEGMRELFGDASFATERALKIYAGCLRDGGDVARAEAILEGLLARYPNAGPQRAILVHMLACAVHDAERHEDAEALYLEAIELAELYVDDPHMLLESKHNLAVVYQQTDRLDEALELALAVVAARERLLAEDHPDLVGSRRNLAQIRAAYRTRYTSPPPGGW